MSATNQIETSASIRVLQPCVEKHPPTTTSAQMHQEESADALPVQSTSKEKDLIQKDQTQTFSSWINIRIQDDPDASNGPWAKVKFDTGAPMNLVFESKVKSFKFGYFHTKRGTVRGLGRDELEVIGEISIYFAFDGKADVVHRADVDVLRDISKDESFDFDILFGREQINKCGALTVNKDVAPRAFVIRKGITKI